MLVAGEESALALHPSRRHDVLVPATGQQTDRGRIEVGGGSLAARARISGLIRMSSVSPEPSLVIVSVM